MDRKMLLAMLAIAVVVAISGCINGDGVCYEPTPAADAGFQTEWQCTRVPCTVGGMNTLDECLTFIERMNSP